MEEGSVLGLSAPKRSRDRLGIHFGIEKLHLDQKPFKSNHFGYISGSLLTCYQLLVFRTFPDNDSQTNPFQGEFRACYRDAFRVWLT